MNLLEIKEKYKQILQEPQSEQSDDQWEMAYSRMKNKRRRHVLTQSNCQNYPTKQFTDDSIVLKLKQKLAQCISNLQKKEKQITQLKQQNLKNQQHLKTYEKQITELKEALSYQEQKIIENKIAYGCIEKDYQGLNKTIQAERLDKQLLRRQIKFFQQQLEQHKHQLVIKDKKIQQLSGFLKKTEKYKNSNTRLKADVMRLKQLLSQTEKYRIFATSIEYKNYLGKPCREHECWYPQDLICDTQNFIKKHQINSNLHNSSSIVTNIVSFMNKHIEQAKKKVQKRTKKICTSRIKSLERKHNHSFNFMEIRSDTLKKSLLRSSMCKSRKTTALNQSKQCTQSFIYDKLQKSLAAHEINQNRDLCIEMLGSFRKGILQILTCKQIKRKKIVKLVDWLVEGMLSIYPKSKLHTQLPLQPEQIKIVS